MAIQARIDVFHTTWDCGTLADDPDELSSVVARDSVTVGGDTIAVGFHRYPNFTLRECLAAIVERTEMARGIRCADCGRRYPRIDHSNCVPF